MTEVSNAELWKAYQSAGKNASKAARDLGIPERTARYRIAKMKGEVCLTDRPQPRRILAWDIETLPSIGFFWRPFNENFSPEQIIKSTTICCFSWQDIATDEIHTVSLLDDMQRFKKDPYDDTVVVKGIHRFMEEAASNGDILLHQNGDNFDTRVALARIIWHDLPPLPPVQTIDTLKAARQARFVMNRLNYLDQHFGGEGKIDVKRGLWYTIADDISGRFSFEERVKAMQEMVEYNRGDIPPLVRVYRRFIPYMAKHPNMAIGTGECCPRCGSKSREAVSFIDKTTRRYPVYRCLSAECRGIYQGTHSISKAWFKPI